MKPVGAHYDFGEFTARFVSKKLLKAHCVIKSSMTLDLDLNKYDLRVSGLKFVNAEYAASRAALIENLLKPFNQVINDCITCCMFEHRLDSFFYILQENTE